MIRKRVCCPSVLLLIDFRRPGFADDSKPSFHGRNGTTQTTGNLLVGEPLHLPDSNRAQLVIAQQPEQAAILLDRLGGELRRRFVAGNVFPAGRLSGRGPLALPLAAALEPAFSFGKVIRLACRDGYE